MLFRSPAYKLGADIVIESAHKTLPAMTQTALLHLCGNMVEANRIQDTLAIYQSSSPSYVLMASLDKCIRELQHNGRIKLEKLLITLDRFYTKVNNLDDFTSYSIKADSSSDSAELTSPHTA